MTRSPRVNGGRAAAWTAALAASLMACAGAPVAPPPAAPPPPPRISPAAAAAAAEGRADRARKLFEEAVQAREAQEKAKAPPDWPALEARFRAVLAVEPLPEAHFNLGVALEQQRRFDEARAEYQAALALRPMRQAATNLGVLAEQEGDQRAAATLYDDAAREFPEEGLARARLAALYRQSGQLEEAWRKAREALLRDPASPLAVKTLIRVALARNDLDLAKLLALRGQKVAPDDAEVAWLAGQVALKAGDEAAASTQWKRALTLQPGLVAARSGLLELAVRRERWAEVAEQAQAILREDPGNAPVQLVRGVALRHLGKPDEALRAYAAAEQLAPGRLPEVELARGILLMRDKGDCPGALAALDHYEKSLGPLLPQGSPAPRLMRECQEQVEQSRQATEAARQLQADAEKKAAEAAARKASEAPAPAPEPEPAVAPAPAAPAPTPAKPTSPPVSVPPPPRKH